MARPRFASPEGPVPQTEMFKPDEWTAKLAIAPGTVYGNSWEARAKNAEELVVLPVAYMPPFGAPRLDTPRAFLSIRSGGVSLGTVVVELRPDAAPLASENFARLCEALVYKGAIFSRIFPDFIVQGGDYHNRCSVVCPPGADCFDLSLVPFAAGGRSIYDDRPDGLFADEPSALRHARGTLSMSNAGVRDSNGSQFFFCIAPEAEPPSFLDGSYVVFGQVVSGFEVLAALSSIGRRDGSTVQRAVCDDCGVLAADTPSLGGAIGAGARGAVAAARRAGAGIADRRARGMGRARRGIAPQRTALLCC